MQTTATSNFTLMSLNLSRQNLNGRSVEAGQPGLYSQAVNRVTRVARKREFGFKVGEYLSAVAERAYSLRRFDTLHNASALLLNLDSLDKFHVAGQYYQALVIYKSGLKNQAEAILEKISSLPRGLYTAKSLLSLGAFGLDRGDLQASSRFRSEALLCAALSPDPLIALEAKRGLAIIKSIDGDHRGALADIESLLATARSMRSKRPELYYDYLNSLAVELCEIGEIDRADALIRIPLATPYAFAYSEWHDTRGDIEAKLRRASRSVIAVIGRRVEPENVVLLDLHRHDRVVEPSPNNGPARVRSYEEWKIEMAKGQRKITEKNAEVKTDGELFNEINDLLTTTILKRRQLEAIVKILRENKREDAQSD